MSELDLSDAKLLALWRTGNREAYAVLVVRYQGLVQAACRRQAPSGEEDDCAQAVFLVLGRKPAAAARAPALAAWLLRTAWYVCDNARRAQRRRRQVAITADRTADSGLAHRPEALDHLDGCLLKLPERQRAAVTLHFLAGKTAEEVAATLGTNRAHAYLLVSRGLAGLRVLLSRRGVAVAGLAGLLAAETHAAGTSAPSGVLASLSGTPSAGAIVHATGAIKAMSLATVIPFAAAAGLVLAAGTLSLALTAEAGAPVPPATHTPSAPLAEVVFTPRTADAETAFRALHRLGGPRVEWLTPAARGKVPWHMRFASVSGRELIGAVATTTGFQAAWLQDGANAILYVGSPDAVIERFRKDLVSPDPSVRRAAAWRGRQQADVRIIPPLVRAAQDVDPETARLAMAGLRNRWIAVVALEASALRLLHADLAHPAPRVRDQAFRALGRVGGTEALPLLERALTNRGTCRLAYAALGELGGRRALTLLEGGLADKDPAVRSTACAALGRMGGDGVLALLEKMTADPDASVREEAYSGLGAMGGERAVVILGKATTDQDKHARAAAYRALSSAAAPASLESLGKALADPDARVRREAARVLGRRGDAQSVVLLGKALADPDADVRTSAYCALGDIGSDAALALFGQTHTDPDQRVRWMACNAFFYRIGDERVLANTEAWLADPADQVRAMAVQGMGQVGGRKAQEMLERLLGDPDASMRQSACSALGAVRGERALTLLTHAITDPDADVRQVTCSALGSFPTEESALTLERALADHDAKVRAAACESLGKMGGEKALALCEGMLADPDTVVRRAVCGTWGRIGGQRAVDLLVRQASIDRVASIRETACNVLGHAALDGVGGERRAALAFLKKALADPDADMREAACRGLGYLGGDAATALLRSALGDQDAAVRQRAADVLATLGEEQNPEQF